MLMWRGFVLLSVLILIGTSFSSPATKTKQKLEEKCLFNDESYEMQIIHVYVCSEVKLTLERQLTNSHAVITIYPRETKESEEEQDDVGVLRINEIPKSIKDWENIELFQVFVYDVEFESPRETIVNVITEMGLDSRKVDHLEVSRCPGFGLIHLRNLDELWSFTVEGTFEGVGSESQIVQVLPQLRRLNFNEIDLTALPSLKGLKYLEEFSIECQTCGEIPEKYFIDNLMLTMINVNAPKMTQVGQDLCQNMKNLEVLFLNTNNAELPPLKDCEALRELIIFNLDENESNRTTKRQPPDWTGLKQLRTLMLQNSGIDSVPVEIIKVNPHLYDINLSYNHIKDIPPYSFVHLSDLQALDLSNNNISVFSDLYVPETIIYLNVKEMLLREYVPEKLLPNLYALQLSDNQLTGVFSLKPFIENYPSMFLFDLKNNLYTTVSLSGPFYAKEDSIEIDLSYNRIVTVQIDPQTVGTKAANDETRITLDLSGNVLRCDCQLKPFVIALRKENSNIYLKSDVKCAESKGKTLKTIQLDEIKC